MRAPTIVEKRLQGCDFAGASSQVRFPRGIFIASPPQKESNGKRHENNRNQAKIVSSKPIFSRNSRGSAAGIDRDASPINPRKTYSREKHQPKHAFIMKSLKVAFLMPLLLFTGCDFVNSQTTPESTPESTTLPPNTLYFSEPIETSKVHSAEDFDFRVETVVEGLKFPWAMAFMPDGRVLITERDGTLRMVENGVLREEPLGGVPEVVARGQGGLLDVHLHPQYEENGWIYLSYSKEGEGGWTTSFIRAQLDGYALVNHEEIYTGNVNSRLGFHFGSRFAFDGEGYLYFSIGDRGEQDTAQDLTVSNGSLFRLHDDGWVPEDNPFVGKEGLDEIYAYGLRNIQGLATDPETGIVWSNFHGPRGGDELNIHNKPGANYGWPVITYGINYNGTPITDITEKEGMEQPVWYWVPSIAPSGMTFVSSNRYPGWKGSILNGALSFQLLSRVEVDGEQFVAEERIVEGIGRIRDVREAPDGYIYIANESDGTIARLVPVSN